MESNSVKHKYHKILNDIDIKKTVKIIDSGSKETNIEVMSCLKDYDVRFLENVKIQYFNLSFNDKLDICRKIMSIYALIVNLHHKTTFLKQRTADVLAFYMAMGYSQNTKEYILEALETNSKNLNQINSELTKKMFLLRDPHNSQKRTLSVELQQLRDFFLNDESESVSFNIRFRKRKDAAPSEPKIVANEQQ